MLWCCYGMREGWMSRPRNWDDNGLTPGPPSQSGCSNKHAVCFPYCAWDFIVKLLEHWPPVVLLGNIPVGIVQEDAMGHDLLLVITEGNSKVCLFSVKKMKTHTLVETTKVRWRQAIFFLGPLELWGCCMRYGYSQSCENGVAQSVGVFVQGISSHQPSCYLKLCFH